MGLFFSGDAQTGAGDRFAVLVVQVGRYGLDGFAVEPGVGEIGQADFVAAHFQIIGGAPVPRGSGSSAAPVQLVQP